MKKYLGILAILAFVVLAVVSVSGCIGSTYSLSNEDKNSINSSINSYFNDIDTSSRGNATTVGSKFNMSGFDGMKIENLTALSNNQAKAVVTRTVQSYKITSATKNHINRTRKEGTTTVKETGTQINYNMSPLGKYEQTWEFTLKKNDQIWKILNASMISSKNVS